MRWLPRRHRHQDDPGQGDPDQGHDQAIPQGHLQANDQQVSREQAMIFYKENALIIDRRRTRSQENV